MGRRPRIDTGATVASGLIPGSLRVLQHVCRAGGGARTTTLSPHLRLSTALRFSGYTWDVTAIAAVWVPSAAELTRRLCLLRPTARRAVPHLLCFRRKACDQVKRKHVGRLCTMPARCSVLAHWTGPCPENERAPRAATTIAHRHAPACDAPQAVLPCT